MANPVEPCRFLDLPTEIRDDIYAHLLRDEPLILQDNAVPVTQNLHTLKVVLHGYIQPIMLRINKQTNFEYKRIAYANMRLEMDLTLLDAIEESPWIPLISTHPLLPPQIRRLSSSLRSVSINIRHDVRRGFEQIDGMRDFIHDLPELRWLKLEVDIAALLVEAGYPATTLVPAARDFFSDLPEPSSSLRGVDCVLKITLALFDQNPNYNWSDRREATLFGECTFHPYNLAIFSATPCPGGDYTWRGLNLEYEGPGMSLDEMMEDCLTNPWESRSPYIT